jgi:hypothetical protein
MLFVRSCCSTSAARAAAASRPPRAPDTESIPVTARTSALETDLIATWALSPYASIEVGYCHFFRGNYVKDSLSVIGSKDADYVYLQRQLSLLKTGTAFWNAVSIPLPVMPVVPRIPESAPFTPQQRAWLDGYLAGLLYDAPGNGASGAAAGSTASASIPVQRIPLLVAFGSQTGSAGNLAKSISREADRRGCSESTLKELNAVSPVDLAAQSLCVLVASTWGDGDLPDNGVEYSGIPFALTPRREWNRFASRCWDWEIETTLTLLRGRAEVG